MRLIHDVHFSPSEIETYRQVAFDNITRGLRVLLEAMEDMEIEVEEANRPHVELIHSAPELKGGEPFPQEYYEPLKSLWQDPNLQKGLERGNEAAIPEK